MNKLKFTENQDLFKRLKFAPGDKSYTRAVCGH